IDSRCSSQPSASAARTPNSTARSFSTGSAPGKPRHTWQSCVFGSAPNRVLQPQKILVAVRSCAWISSPITGSNVATDVLIVPQSIGDWRLQNDEYDWRLPIDDRHCRSTSEIPSTISYRQSVNRQSGNLQSPIED